MEATALTNQNTRVSASARPSGVRRHRAARRKADDLVAEGKTVLFVAWLAWSRYRIVIALRDRTAPSVFAALDRCFRLSAGDSGTARRLEEEIRSMDAPES